ncbi:YrhC family protein [Neobacillus pocheonensis]|uniref:YrhC family protein n=1 Tax=Neobacillus pocheonensis TaxID=363869 RepID=A0ABT0W5F3_9BACI|nr:YrhC family protein [Neobacillus pocheonensis]
MNVKTQAKNLFEKMVDYKRFATVLLAVGAFFYLGVIIPNETRSVTDLNMMILSSMSFLAVSFLFFIQSKKCQIKLSEMEDSQDMQMKK